MLPKNRSSLLPIVLSLFFIKIKGDYLNDGSGQIALTECGGILKSPSGSIQYTPGEKLNEQEGCFWKISTPFTNTSHLKFYLKSSGFVQQESTFLSIGYFANSEYDSAAAFQWKKFGSSTPESMEIPSPVAFVHFVHSQPDEYLDNGGFHLNFEAVNGSFTPSSCIYTNMILRGSTGAYKYPESGKYLNWERTVIVIDPQQFTFDLTIKWRELENKIEADSLSIWSFNFNNVWTRNEQLSLSRSIPETYTLDTMYHPVLLVFKSDSNGTYNGFEFKWQP